MLSRRTFLTGASATAAGLFLRPRLALAALGGRANFTPIRAGVGTFQARGGTIGYLITGDAVAVVDTQYPDTAAECRNGLGERSGRTVDFVINTHHHGDHTAGNAVLSADAGMLVAHAESARLQRASAESRGNSAEQAFPTSTYEETLALDVGGRRISLTHFGPAHTGGDSVVYFEDADVVHMGDLVFNRMPPFIDKAGGASIEGWIGLLETVHGHYSDDTVFIHGHAGPNYTAVGTREDLLVMRDFLSGLLDYVQTGLASGTSLEELTAVDRLPDFPEHYLESWENAIPNAIRAAHQELTSTD